MGGFNYDSWTETPYNGVNIWKNYKPNTFAKKFCYILGKLQTQGVCENFV